MNYATQIDNLGDMDKFVEIYNFPRLNHEEPENLKRLVNSKEIKTAF